MKSASGFLRLKKVYLKEPEQSSFGDIVIFIQASSPIKPAEKRFMSMQPARILCVANC